MTATRGSPRSASRCASLPARIPIAAMLLVAVSWTSAEAVPSKRACLKGCEPLIAACTARNGDLGNFRRVCRASIVSRCRRDGVAACGVFCGNGLVDGTEACDGPDLGGATCASLGFGGGTLACTADCALDVRGCIPALVPPRAACGNGVAETGEACDGGDLRSRTCVTEGFLDGVLGCSASCTLDTHACIDEPPATTALLLPFVTNRDGWDTGIAIVNTTADPFGTTPKSGTCTVRFVGSGTAQPVTIQTTPTIAAGTTFAFSLSGGGVPGNTTPVTGLRGMARITCDFPLARAYVFVSDFGAREVAWDAPVEVVPSGGENRGPPPADETSLLFPFVSDAAGFDTTIVITNPSGTAPGLPAAEGSCSVFAYSGNGEPATQVSEVVPAGGQLVFSLATGGNLGLVAIPSFQGYVIARCLFPGARGVGYVGDVAHHLAATVPAEVIPAGPRR